jgi:hypothetical protein
MAAAVTETVYGVGRPERVPVCAAAECRRPGTAWQGLCVEHDDVRGNVLPEVFRRFSGQLRFDVYAGDDT